MTTERTKNRDSGFTLVEILVAIVLVGILAAVVVIGIGRLTEKASAASCATSADAARTGVSSYYASNGRYPTSFAEMTAVGGVGGPALVLPAGATVAGSVITVKDWTLTMSATTPPAFTCGVVSAGSTTTTAVAATTTAAATSTTASAATTTAATTTTVVAANGVTVVPSVAGSHQFYGENILTLSNTSAVTSMSVTIRVVRTTGLAYQGQYHDFWSGTVTSGNSSTSSEISYTFVLNAGQPIVPGTWKIDAQTSGTGTQHPTAGDTWSVTTRSQGITTTLTGTF